MIKKKLNHNFQQIIIKIFLLILYFYNIINIINNIKYNFKKINNK